MTNFTTTTTLAPPQVAGSTAGDAARRLHRAEIALHDAHATNVDAWISAAADRLHEAVEQYLRSLSA